jgi:hypothetical protein
MDLSPYSRGNCKPKRRGANQDGILRTFRYGQTRLSLSLSLSLSLTRFRRKPPAVKAMINGAE